MIRVTPAPGAPDGFYRLIFTIVLISLALFIAGCAFFAAPVVQAPAGGGLLSGGKISPAKSAPVEAAALHAVAPKASGPAAAVPAAAVPAAGLEPAAVAPYAIAAVALPPQTPAQAGASLAASLGAPAEVAAPAGVGVALPGPALPNQPAIHPLAPGKAVLDALTGWPANTTPGSLPAATPGAPAAPLPDAQPPVAPTAASAEAGSPEAGNPHAGTPAVDTSPVVRLVIAPIRVDTPVTFVPFNGSTWMIGGLTNEIAWMGATSWPGLGGNTGLAAHVDFADGSPGPFWRLRELDLGDAVLVYTEKFIYSYAVRGSVLVSDADLSVIAPSVQPQITLITCAGWDPIRRAYTQRLAVFADLTSVRPVE